MRHHQGAATSLQRPGTDGYIQEELEMHELESEIINKTTNGKFYQYLDTIVDKKKPQTFQDLITSLELEELLEFDRILGITDSGFRVSNTALGHCYIALIIRFLQRENSQEEYKKKSIDAYHWISNKI